MRLLQNQSASRTVSRSPIRTPMSHSPPCESARNTPSTSCTSASPGSAPPMPNIPAPVRMRAIAALIDRYFSPGTVVQAGYPLDMRYAGPREALLHALFRQNYGCSHLLVGRDHAGVGSYYGPFDAHHVFSEIPAGSLVTRPLKIDWTFWCYRCGGMASGRTCPHADADRLLVSGTKLRKWLSEGSPVPPEFSRPEVLDILRAYYASLDARENVEVKLLP